MLLVGIIIVKRSLFNETIFLMIRSLVFILIHVFQIFLI